MSFRLFLVVMSLASTAAWIGWIVVVQAVDPTRSGSIGLILFYLTLSTALIGSFSVIGVLGRLWQKPDELLVSISSRAFRQSVLLTSIFVGTLFLSGLGLLRWWTVLLLFLIVCFLELIFLTMRQLPLEHKKYSKES